jgi:hypothetical protein
MEHISRLGALTTLRLEQNNVHDDGLRHLATLTALNHLDPSLCT